LILQSLFLALGLQNLFLAFSGTFLGIIMGALPGIGATMTMALLLPFTYWMKADAALILLGAVYCGCVYGGSISAILLNTPGTPASAATTFDGYPMSKKGKGMTAIGISAMASFVGGVVGLFFLMTLSPVLAEISLKFGPSEFFMLTLFTFLVISFAVVKGSVFKGLIAIGIGLVLSTIGYDPVSGGLRFTFGITYLEDGIKLIPSIIGLFAVSEAFALSEKGGTIAESPDVHGNVLNGCKAVFRYPMTLIKSVLIGSGIGALPGIGVSAANLIAYVVSKSGSRHADEFGEGAEEGVIAPEASNNAVTATSLIPLLTLGIPGSAASAVLMGALMIQGLTPGASLFSTDGLITYTFFFGLLFANLFILIITLLMAKFFVKITVVRVEILVPIIVSLCCIGTYALNYSLGDVFMTIAFGFLGYILRKAKYPLICLLLPLILGKTMETTFHQAMMISRGSPAVFFSGTINIVLWVLIFVSILLPFIIRKKAKTFNS